MSVFRWYGDPVFTGLVECAGRVEAIEKHNGILRLWIGSPFTDLQLGESVSVDGACLTVATLKEGCFQADVSQESQRLTIALRYEVGTTVNLERALKVGDRLGGHWVTGHVDGNVVVSRIDDREQCRWIRIEGVHPQDRALLTRKGCVALNGVSLTVNEVSDDAFAVLLVPHTLGHTNLQDVRPGDVLNVEWDWMAKMIVEALNTRLAQRKNDAHPLH